MSIKIMTAVWENGPENSTQRFVLLKLADHAADDGTSVYPSIDTIAKCCALSRATVMRAIKGLAEDGYITYRRRRNESNLYRINIKRLEIDPGSINLQLPEGTPEVSNCDIGKYQIATSGSVNLIPDPSINHQSTPTTTPPPESEPETAEEEAGGEVEPVWQLVAYFCQKANVGEPYLSALQTNWEPTLKAILEFTNGDIEKAKAIIGASVDYARKQGNYSGRDGRSYPVVTPHSIRSSWANRAAEMQDAANTVNPETIWERVLAHLHANKPPDEPRLLAAVKSVGWPALMAADEYSTPRLKSQLFNAYRSAPA